MTTLEEVEALAKELSKEERELLAYRLHEMDEVIDPSEELFDEEQNRELHRRIEEYRNGTADLITLDEMRADIRKLRDEHAG